MTDIKKLITALLLTFSLSLLFCSAVHAETYTANMDLTVENKLEHVRLSVSDSRGNRLWYYDSGYYPPGSELDNFHMIAEDGYLFLIEKGSIKRFDIETGRILWTNSDFQGSPGSDDAYEISSSGKLYIAGYQGPDLFIVDSDGNTISRVRELKPGSYFLDKMEFVGDDNLKVYYDSHFSGDKDTLTINVLDYFGIIEWNR